MSRFIFCLLSIMTYIILPAQISQSPIDTVTQAIIKFDYKLLDLGKIKINSKKIGKFSFTNIGDKELIIKDVKSHCGCTVANYSKQPIKKGEQGEVTIEYSAPSFPCFIEKTIIIISNTYEKSHLLKIRAEITE